ncbi:uncharacterized protein LOC143257602 isoform X3 [Tachypleus tridentatus]|uniref:uncharacterized protein LOC143257602 isoform X3 n=1 Tax=Tachypleus tridentatus TaxID=6853 RepID=UPI003FD59D07
MSNTGAPVDELTRAIHLGVEEVILEEGLSESDEVFCLIKDLLFTEQEYYITLRSVCDMYEKPLRKLLCFGPDEHKALFEWVDPISSLSNLVINKVILRDWDPLRSRVGNVFSKHLWTTYGEYQEHLNSVAVPLLKEKELNDEEFLALCQQRQGDTKHSLQDFLFLPLERLVQYESVLSQVAAQTLEKHPDYSGRWRAASKVVNMVRGGETAAEETDLDRVQNLFPNDNLNLYENEHYFSQRKTLFRNKGAAANRINRDFSAKGTKGAFMATNALPIRDGSMKIKAPSRSFIMDSSVQFMMGVQRQDRHLFLFNDILLVAKPRFSGTYKLKDKILVNELWLSSCLSEVCEPIISPEVSFILGWPTTNVVVTFSSPQAKQLWQSKLKELIAEVKKNEKRNVTSLQVCYWDYEVNEEFFKTVKVSNTQSTFDCVRLILDDIHQQYSSIEDYQLWVKTRKEETPYPLLGHEFPFYIKMNFVRGLLQQSNFDLQNFSVSSDTKCIFILRQCSTDDVASFTDPTGKKKRPRRPTLMGWPFKRNSSKQENSNGNLSSAPSSSVFAKSISKLWEDDNLPKPVMAILTQLYRKGPYTVGIFRKSANTRMCKELKIKLEANPDFDFKNVPVVMLAALFKEFLRSLPDCILSSSMYNEWLEVINCTDEWDKRNKAMELLKQISSANMKLLEHFLCVLWHISQHSVINKMSPENLAVCVGPSMLYLSTSNRQQSMLQPEVSKQVPKIVAYLISQFPDLFGKECMQLFDGVLDKDPLQKNFAAEEQFFGEFLDKDILRHDSGAEESDSLHSQQEIGGCRQDDSSIDSLERELLEGNKIITELPSKNQISLTNLSRDSGLTLSDTQLYTPEDEDECEEPRKSIQNNNQIIKSTPNLDLVGIEASNHPTKNTEASIDGTCNKVMGKRGQVQVGCYPESTMSSPLQNQNKSGFQTRSCQRHNVHLPIHYSRSYSFGAGDTFLYCLLNPLFDEAATEVERNVHSDGPQLSSTKISNLYPVPLLRRTASEDSLSHIHCNQPSILTPPAYGITRQKFLTGLELDQNDYNISFKKNGDNYPCSDTEHWSNRCATEAPTDNNYVDSKCKTLLCSDKIDSKPFWKSTPSLTMTDETDNSQNRDLDGEELSLFSATEFYNGYHNSSNISHTYNPSSKLSHETPVSVEEKGSKGSLTSVNSAISSGSGDLFYSQSSRISNRTLKTQRSEPLPEKSLMMDWLSTYQETLSQRPRGSSFPHQQYDRSSLGSGVNKPYKDTTHSCKEGSRILEKTCLSFPANIPPTPPPTPPKPQKTTVHLETHRIMQSDEHQAMEINTGKDNILSGLRWRPPEDWRKEISWSVAELRDYFDKRFSRHSDYMNQSQKQNEPPFQSHLPNSSTKYDEDCITVVRVRGSGRTDPLVTVRKRTDLDTTCSSSSRNSLEGKESYV